MWNGNDGGIKWNYRVLAYKKIKVKFLSYSVVMLEEKNCSLKYLSLIPLSSFL